MSVSNSYYLTQFKALASSPSRAEFATIADKAKNLAAINWENDGKLNGNNFEFLAGVDNYDFYFSASTAGRTLEIRRRGNDGFDQRVARSQIPSGQKMPIDIESKGAISFADGTVLSIEGLRRLALTFEMNQTVRYSLAANENRTVLYRLNPNQRDYIDAGPGNDQIRATGGISGSGSFADYVNGGEGWDTLFLEGKNDDYSFIKAGGDVMIIFGDHQITVSSIEQVRFLGADRKFNERFTMDDLVNRRRRQS
jgi:hypothetical protein